MVVPFDRVLRLVDVFGQATVVLPPNAESKKYYSCYTLKIQLIFLG